MPSSMHARNATEIQAWLQSLVLGQHDRPLRLRIGGPDAPLADALLIHSFAAEERSCESTSLRLRLLCVSTRVDIRPQQLLGQAVQLQVITDSSDRRLFNALVMRAQPGPFDGGLQTWLLEAVDACAFMDAGRNSRLYLRKSVLDITEHLLGEWRERSPVLAGSFGFDTSALSPDRYPQREMSIQWNESDPAFLMRLWRKHGIAWGVRAEADGPADPPRHTLVLLDSGSQLPANRAGRLRCHTGASVQGRDDITLWNPAGQLTPGLVERSAWDYKRQRTQWADAPTTASQGEQGALLSRALLDARIEPPTGPTAPPTTSSSPCSACCTMRCVPPA